MNCYLILIGSELLNGMMVETNSLFMAEKLNKYGIEIVGKSVVGDKIDEIVKHIDFAKKSADFVFISGGLGPTIDDLTRDAVSKYTGRDLVYYEDEYKKIEKKFKKSGIDIPERNRRQAMLPKGSMVIENGSGSASAFYVDKIAVFPGVPYEMEDTFVNFLNYFVVENKIESKLYIKDILFWGIPESELEGKIIDLVEEVEGIFIEFLVKDYGVLLRLLFDREFESKAAKISELVYERVGEFIFGEDEDRIENLLLEELSKKKFDISVAESCSGGEVSAKLVSVPGVSTYFTEGLVTYSNSSKIERLGVKKITIEKYGAVSEEVVKEMLYGLKSDTGIAISGVAGPSGGTEEKPVGTVVIGSRVKKGFKIKTYYFRGTRDRVRARATLTALNDLRKHLEMV